jgi:hypothetical protein
VPSQPWVDIGPSTHGPRLKAHIISTYRADVMRNRILNRLPVKALNGKPLPFRYRLKSRISELFYSIPSEDRRKVKIPSWYCDTVNVPKYYFRTKGNTFSPKQTCISMIARLYYMYRFLYSRNECNTATLLRGCRDDSVYRLLLRVSHTPKWYALCNMAYRRLKVLFRS